MKNTMFTTLLILLMISTVTLADDYRTGTCGQSTTNRCEHIWVDNDGVVTSNRHDKILLTM